MNKPKDMAFEALLEASHKAAPDLPIDLLTAIYQLEKRSQFDQNRDLQSAIQKLIESHLNANSGVII